MGLDDRFGTAMSYAQSLLSSINVDTVASEVEYLRTADADLVAHALTIPARLLHLMSHGGIAEDGTVALWGVSQSGSRDISLDLGTLSSELQRMGRPIGASAIFADACHTAQASYTRAMRDAIAYETVYVGATRMVYWRECTTFGSILYGSMLRAKGKGTDPYNWMLSAANRAVDAYEMAVAGSCPFKVLTLTPSRAARKAFG